MSRRSLAFSGLFMLLLGAMPLAVTAHEGQWHLPLPAAHTGAAGRPDVVVTATLTEYRIALDPANPVVRAGQHVLFVIENKGKLDHELMITSATMSGMGAMSMAQMDALSMATVGTDQLHPGATVRLNIVFATPGTYQIACHLPGHEAMKTSITVSAA